MSRVEGNAASAAAAGVAVRNGNDWEFTALRPLYRLEGRSPADRAQAHRANVANRWLDVADFKGFLERFVEEARQAKTLDAFVAHGRPDFDPWSHLVRERDANFKEHRDFEAVEGAFRAATRDALVELEKIRAKLENRRMPGDVDLTGSVALKARVAGREVGVEAALHEGSVSGAVGFPGAKLEATLRDGHPSDSIQVGGGPVCVAPGRDRIESATVRIGAAYGKLDADSIEVGVAAGRRIGPEDGPHLVAEAKLGVSVQPLDAETVRRALSAEDTWTIRR